MDTQPQNQYIKVKTHLSAFAPLSDELLAAIITHMSPGKARKGEILIHQGDFNDRIYLVLAGSVRAYHVVADKEYTDWFALEGQFFSALACYFEGRPSTHTYEALQQTEFLSCPKDFLETLADAHHAVERLVRKVITDSFLTLQNRVVYHRFKSARDRYEELVKNSPEIVQQIPLKHLASYLGISPETLSRIRADQASLS